MLRIRIRIIFWKLDPDLNPHHFGKQEPDPHQSVKLDPDSHQSEKQDSDPHQSEKVEALKRVILEHRRVQRWTKMTHTKREK